MNAHGRHYACGSMPQALLPEWLRINMVMEWTCLIQSARPLRQGTRGLQQKAGGGASKIFVTELPGGVLYQGRVL